MKAYRVKIGYHTDFYGRICGEESIYFLNKTKAEAKLKEGEYQSPRTRITTIYKDGTRSIGYTGAHYYKDYLEKAKPNEVVELIMETCNHYRLEEIDIIEGA